MQAVRVLGWVHEFKDAIGVKVLGQRELDDVAGNRWIRIEPNDLGFELLLRGVLGKIHADRSDAHLRAVTVLAPYVGVRAGIVSDEDCAEPGRNPPLLQARNASREVVLNGSRRCLAIKSYCRHRLILAG
jgi:hypothetical protein